MTRFFVGTTAAAVLCLSMSIAFGEPRGKGVENKEKGGEPRGKAGEKSAEKPPGENKNGNKPPGGAWSESKSSTGKQSEAKQAEELEGKNKSKSPQPSAAEGAAAENAAAKNKSSQATGAEGAAAGAAASNRNKSQASGAEGAAAGAAVSNRNKPQATGAEGAAAGDAAANRNKPAASGAEGAAVGAAAVNRNKPSVSGAEGAAAGAAVANQRHPLTSGEVGGYAAVRNSFDHPNLYNEQWHADHPGAWTANNWAAGATWNATNMAGVATYLGYTNNVPVSYNYGQNVTCQNGNVFLNGQDVGTAEHFSQQAANLALAGQEAETTDMDEWLPLGVFALVRNEDQHPQLSLQLATNKNGIIRGNYTDLVTDHTLPINGSIEQETQRAAWTVGDNKNFFMEAGISNLTSGEAPALIHKYGRTEKWFLVRLPQPGSEEPVAAN